MPLSVAAIEASFRDAAERRGLAIKQLRADGTLHRCDAAGKRGKGDGAYLLHLDGVPAGGFENHRDGLGWQTWRADIRLVLSGEERAAYRAKIERERRERETARLRTLQEAQRKAAWIFKQSKPATYEHSYLVRKRVQAHGLRDYRGLLLVPMRTLDGKLRSLQFISPDSGKRFLRGGATAGCLYGIGRGTPSGPIAIAEGFATGASVHEATGIPVAVAFDSGNLLPVARALRAKYPAAAIVICADDDWRRRNPVTGELENIGTIKACEAANIVDAVVAIPVFGEGRGAGDTDFNDLACRAGIDAVREQIERALRIVGGEVRQCA